MVREGTSFVKDEAEISFRAQWDVSSKELCILTSEFVSPMSKISVLEELRVRRLAVIQEEIR